MESNQNAGENTVAITGENDTKATSGVKGKTRQAPKRGAKKQPAKTEDNPGVSESDSKEVAQYMLPVEMPVEQAKEVLADDIVEIKTDNPSLSDDAASKNLLPIL